MRRAECETLDRCELEARHPLRASDPSVTATDHLEIWEMDIFFSKILMKVVGQQAQTHMPEKDQEGEVAIGRE